MEQLAGPPDVVEHPTGLGAEVVQLAAAAAAAAAGGSQKWIAAVGPLGHPTGPRAEVGQLAAAAADAAAAEGSQKWMVAAGPLRVAEHLAASAAAVDAGGN